MYLCRFLHLLALTCAVHLLTPTVNGAANAADNNWPQWRGPHQTGASASATPPVTWSPTTNIKWKTKIPGRGSGTPIIWGNQIFLQTAIPTGRKIEAAGAPAPAAAEPSNNPGQGRGPRGRGGGMSVEKPTEIHQFGLMAIDPATGRVQWQKIVREEVPHEGHHRDHGFASFSPVTDGSQVYASFGSRGIYCFDLQGNRKWEKDLGKMRTKMSFGEGSSPAVSGDTVVVLWDHEGEDAIVALDKATGKERWRQTRDEETSWSTPLIVEGGGRKQVITAATRKIRSYDLADGKLLWECSGLTPNAIPTPVPGEGVVYVTSGFRGHALLAIRLDRTGDLTGTDAILWQQTKSTPYVPSPVRAGNRLYLLADNSATLSCFDVKTGKSLIDAERLPPLGGVNVYASLVAAAGHVYIVGRNGTTVVIKDADTLEIVATNPLGEKVDASPALAGKDLFLRGEEHLYCIARP